MLFDCFGLCWVEVGLLVIVVCGVVVFVLFDVFGGLVLGWVLIGFGVFVCLMVLFKVFV